jgi:hypothetical protein
MDKSEKFSDYLFAKMGPSNGIVQGVQCSKDHHQSAPTTAATKMTDCSDGPTELTGVKKWLDENLMLLVTLSGVVLGVIIGECFFFILTLYCLFSL